MNAEVKKLWVEALRSGKYKQGEGALLQDGCHCCYGVLCEVAIEAGVAIKKTQVGTGVTFGGARGMPPRSVADWAGMEGSEWPRVVIQDRVGRLSVLNDDGATFAEIADAIEAQL